MTNIKFLLSNPDLIAIKNVLFYTSAQLYSYWREHLKLDAQEHNLSGDLKTSLDTDCESIILNSLNSLKFPWLAFSEEQGEVRSKVYNGQAKWTFLIDPLDATHNAVHGFPAFTSSIAGFLEDQLYLGWIYDPSHDSIFFAVKDRGAYIIRNEWNRRLFVNKTTDISQAVVGLIRPKDDQEYLELNKLITKARKIRCISCSSLEISYVAAGIYDAFVDASTVGWEKHCDIAAAMLILEEAGGYVTDKYADPVRFRVPCSASLVEKTTVIAACSLQLIDSIVSTIN